MAFKQEITATGAVLLGDASPGIVGTFLIQLDDNSSGGPFAATLQGRARDGTNNDWVAINYFDRKTTAGVPVTDALGPDELIVVDAAGLELRLNVTTLSSGGVYLNVVPLLG